MKSSSAFNIIDWWIFYMHHRFSFTFFRCSMNSGNRFQVLLPSFNSYKLIDLITNLSFYRYFRQAGKVTGPNLQNSLRNIDLRWWFYFSFFVDFELLAEAEWRVDKIYWIFICLLLNFFTTIDSNVILKFLFSHNFYILQDALKTDTTRPTTQIQHCNWWD